MPTLAMPRLTRQEVDGFYANGYTGPHAACTPEEMAVIRREVEENVLTTDGPWQKFREQMRHFDKRVVFDLCNNPEVVGRMASLLGNDLMVWRSNFFTKEPGGREIPWHQDIGYWKLDPPLNLTVWMALDDVTTENSCVQLIPGSHTRTHRMVKSPPGMEFSEMTDPDAVDPGKAINMVLKPGEFFIFNERILHHSDANHSNKRRMCFVIRMTVPFVKIPPLFPGHKLMMVSGEDRFGINEYGQPFPRE